MRGSPFNTKSETFDPADFATFDNTLTTIRRKPRMLKQLFDSEYVKPSENYRVFQDTDPRKHAVYNEALKRYEEQLKQQGVEIKKEFEVMSSNQNTNSTLNQADKQHKKETQKLYNQEIVRQIEKNVSNY